MKFYTEKLCLDEKNLENSPALCLAAYRYYMACATFCIRILTRSLSVCFKGGVDDGHDNSSFKKHS